MSSNTEVKWNPFCKKKKNPPQIQTNKNKQTNKQLYIHHKEPTTEIVFALIFWDRIMCAYQKKHTDSNCMNFTCKGDRGYDIVEPHCQPLLTYFSLSLSLCFSLYLSLHLSIHTHTHIFSSSIYKLQCSLKHSLSF